MTHSSHLPTLQICGIPLALSSDEVMRAFKKGWEHVWNSEACLGYYIGRQHTPFTEVRVVRSVSAGDSAYCQDCEEGEPGYLITRGGHVMASYVGLEDAVKKAISDDGWYLNLGDIGFWFNGIPAGKGSVRDLYWQSRDSHMLIRGGANYSFEQVKTEIEHLLCSHYHLESAEFHVAICGLREKSEHEDECCVLVELVSENAKEKKDDISATFLSVSQSKGAVSKGSRPDRFAIGAIPIVTSKGVIDVVALVKYWKSK